MNLYISIKNIFSKFLYNFGVLKWLEKNTRSNIILGYHHILPEDHEWINFLLPGMYVTTKTFEKHINYLRENYDIIPLHQIQLKTKRKKCVITFDDGWVDNYRYAYPILKKYNLPATIFLTTGMIGKNNWAWPDRLSYYIHNASKEKLIKLINIIANYRLLKNQKIKRDFLGKNNRFLISEDSISNIKQLGIEKVYSVMENIDSLMYDLKTKLEYTYPWLSWEQIDEMRKNNIYFGLHTHNHYILTNMSLAKAEKEIELSKETIYRKLNIEADTFSYPNGNYNNKIVNLVKEQGLKYAVTTEKGFIDQSKDFLHLKRILIHDDISNNLPLFIYLLISSKFNYMN